MHFATNYLQNDKRLIFSLHRIHGQICTFRSSKRLLKHTILAPLRHNKNTYMRTSTKKIPFYLNS